LASGFIVNGSASSYNLTPTSSIPAGDLAILVCGSGNTAAFNFVVSDSAGGNTWTYPTTTTNTSQTFLDSGQAVTLSYAYSVLSTTITTSNHLTLTPSVTSFFDCYILDMTSPNATPLDQSVGHHASFSTTITSSSLTPGSQPAIAIGIFMWAFTSNFSAYGNVIGSAATGLANGQDSAANADMGIEYRRITATTAGTSTLTVASNVSGTTLFFTMKGN
jgi:hypothetical protein